MSKEYPVPDYPEYFVTEEGEIVSYCGKTRRVLKQKPQKNARCRKQVKLRGDTFTTHRVILSAKLGRWLEPWEQTRHIDSDRNNNAMDNLLPGCAILNMIDDIENGSRRTSLEYIREAIDRLERML